MPLATFLGIKFANWSCGQLRTGYYFSSLGIITIFLRLFFYATTEVLGRDFLPLLRDLFLPRPFTLRFLAIFSVVSEIIVLDFISKFLVLGS
jgi:hypothetical protein